MFESKKVKLISTLILATALTVPLFFYMAFQQVICDFPNSTNQLEIPVCPNELQLSPLKIFLISGLLWTIIYLVTFLILNIISKFKK